VSRKPIEPEKLFVKNITTLINNLLVENKNYKNGYYSQSCHHHFNVINDTIERAKYILSDIESTKHLLDVTAFKELIQLQATCITDLNEEVESLIEICSLNGVNFVRRKFIIEAQKEIDKKKKGLLLIK